MMIEEKNMREMVDTDCEEGAIYLFANNKQIGYSTLLRVRLKTDKRHGVLTTDRFAVYGDVLACLKDGKVFDQIGRAYPYDDTLSILAYETVTRVGA